MKLPRRLALFACAVALVSAAAPAADWEAMPPKEADALTSTQITDLKIWIAGGAPWPDAARQKVIAASSAEKWSAEDGVTVPTSGGLSADWTNRRYKPDGLWGYQPVKKPAVPAAASIENPKSKIEKPIDAFIAARLPTALPVAPDAAPRAFIRRATFDLTGLLPTPDEIAAFEADSIQNPQTAIANLIDRLLASPH